MLTGGRGQLWRCTGRMMIGVVWCGVGVLGGTGDRVCVCWRLWAVPVQGEIVPEKQHSNVLVINHTHKHTHTHTHTHHTTPQHNTDVQIWKMYHIYH